MADKVHSETPLLADAGTLYHMSFVASTQYTPIPLPVRSHTPLHKPHGACSTLLVLAVL